MAKVTSKLQVTIPKALADRYGLRPGDEIDWEAAGDALRVTPHRRPGTDPAERLRRFDRTTERLRRRRPAKAGAGSSRGWTREELYERARAR